MVDSSPCVGCESLVRARMVILQCPLSEAWDHHLRQGCPRCRRYLLPEDSAPQEVGNRWDCEDPPRPATGPAMFD